MKGFGPGVALTFGDDHALMTYAPVDGLPTPPPLRLHPLVGLILLLFDRDQDTETVADYLAETLQLPPEDALEITQDTAFIYAGHFNNDLRGTHVEAVDPEDLTAFLRTRPEPLKARTCVFFDDRAPFPVTLQWLVTRFCNRACVYCYQGAIPSKTAKDADLLRLDELKGILTQARRLGTYLFFLTGGEPLLRPESYEVVAHALRLGMKPDFLSKQFIDDAGADRLAEAGLETVYLSVDSLEAEAARRLTGIGNFADQISATISRLVSRRIRVAVQGVVTPINLDHMPETLDRFRALGVTRVHLDPYSANIARHDTALALSPDQVTAFSATLATHTRGWDDMHITFSPDHPLDLHQDFFICNNGATTLLFLPDGTVSRCDKPLPGDLTAGNLRTQAVHEVWQSRRMAELFKPPRALYKDTDCYTCDRFHICHERGRCFYDAYINSGTLYGPQGHTCVYMAEKTKVLC